ncbi:hypothetical protein C8Q70DRAFT_1053793 [Cubamyces menziesii]|nr:hypothetical protein C8Q70DRAFT_1053793 [Cubamyces menziesii]
MGTLDVSTISGPFSAAVFTQLPVQRVLPSVVRVELSSGQPHAPSVVLPSKPPHASSHITHVLRHSRAPTDWQEDGEVFSPPPPKPPPLAPRAHSPPTQPRSFYTVGVSLPPRRSSPPPIRRPLHPASYRNSSTRPLLGP